MPPSVRFARLTVPIAIIITFGCGGGDPPSAPAGVVPEQPATTGIPIVHGSTIGRPMYPAGDTPSGGQGETKSGVGCIRSTGAYHIHSHLTLFVKGEQIAIAAGIGVVPPTLTNGYAEFDPANCFYWLHTHDATGVIHVNPGENRDMTLGMLFDVWGYPLSRTEVAGNFGDVVVYIDGLLYTGDVREVVFKDNRQINLQVGEPHVKPPVYIIPANP